MPASIQHQEIIPLAKSVLLANKSQQNISSPSRLQERPKTVTSNDLKTRFLMMPSKIGFAFFTYTSILKMSQFSADSYSVCNNYSFSLFFTNIQPDILRCISTLNLLLHTIFVLLYFVLPYIKFHSVPFSPFL